MSGDDSSVLGEVAAVATERLEPLAPNGTFMLLTPPLVFRSL
jgi:hypothetical protein